MGQYPHSIVNTDFNGDGIVDLVTANTSNSISTLVGNGAGGFGLGPDFAVGSEPWSIVASDFDGDGNIDVATANRQSNNIGVLLGNGSGSFSLPAYFATGTNPGSIICNDFNGDGKLDIATGNRLSNDISVLMGNGLGSFSSPTNFSVGIWPNSLISSDFNNDGNLDIATVNSNSNYVLILVGDGTGNFATDTNSAGSVINFPVEVGPVSIASADLNGDFLMDLAVSIADSSNEVNILINNTGSENPFPTLTNQAGMSEMSFLIYPNPSNGEFTIEMPKGRANISIEVYNDVGALVYTDRHTNIYNAINLSDEPNGLYLVNVVSVGKIIASQKVRKK